MAAPESPAAPLDRAVEEAREALCMFDQPCTPLPHEVYQDQAIEALRAILAALDAELPALRLALETATREATNYKTNAEHWASEYVREHRRADAAERERDEARAKVAASAPPADAPPLPPGCTHDPSLVCLRCRVVIPMPAPPAHAAREAVREAVLALLSEPGDLEYPVEDVYSEGPDVDGNGDAPFWSEAGLYGRVGKEAARTLLARHRRATEALAALSSPAPAPAEKETR